MATYGDFVNYGVDPWAGISLDERPWYDPILLDLYMRMAVYSPWATFKVQMDGENSPNARTIYFNELIPPRPNIAPLEARKMEASRLYQDSAQRSITTAR